MIEHHHGSYREPRKRVFMVRSTRTAKKPTHWVQDGDRFVLASEIENRAAYMAAVANQGDIA